MDMGSVVFISRASADAGFATEVRRVLEAAGHRVVVQDRDFDNRNFIDAMHEALSSEARVVALISPAYLESEYCSAEWQNAIAGDPLNRSGRLVLLRIAECRPTGLLAGLAYWDLVPLGDNASAIADVIRRAVDGRVGDESATDAYRAAADQIFPAGVVTFLFTDIESAEEHWEETPTAMRRALGRHDALLFETIERHNGRIFASSGGAFRAAFQDAGDAANAAAETQKTVSTGKFSEIDGFAVRIAVDSGSADRIRSDYVGRTVHHAARLLAIANGGQVLASPAAAQLARGTISPQMSFLDLGAFQLRDGAPAEQVMQLVADGLPSVFPPLRSVKTSANNLPLEASSFVGRESVVAEITELTKAHRIVTITGPGGVGKSRSALEAASRVLDDYAHGVWFVELAPLADSSVVAAAIAAAVGIRLPPSLPVESTLPAALKNRSILIILDNCEHVLAATAAIAGAIVQTSPNVHLLATSREALGVAGEELYPMPSLSVPPAEPAPTAATVEQYDAAALLIERAKTIEKRFVLTDRNAPLVAEIARRLDGIPLAIELAAARMKTLGIADLARRLDERLSLLTGGSRTAVPRQQTMRALFDWSYELLSESEAAAFRKVSIFAGGFTLETAESIALETPGGPSVVDLLASLVDKSLLNTDFNDYGTRYSVLETTKEYAREKLVERGEYEATAHAHATAYLRLADDLDAQWGTTAERTWSQKVGAELENWRSALEWTLAKRKDVLLGQRLLVALRRGELPISDRVRWLKIAQDEVNDTTPKAVLAALDLSEAQLAASLFQYKTSLPAAKRALAAFSVLSDTWGVAPALRYVGSSLNHLGKVAEGEESLQAALSTYRKLDSQRDVGWVLQDLGDSRNLAGDIEGARRFYAEALALFKSIGAEERCTSVARNLAEAEFRVGEVDAALKLARDVLQADRLAREPLLLANDLLNLSAYLIAKGTFEDAAACAREALSVARKEHSEIYTAIALQHLAAGSALARRATTDLTVTALRRAASLMGYVEACLDRLAITRQYTEQQEVDRVMFTVKQSLGQSEVDEAMREGRQWTLDRALLEALESAGQ